jgi:hypothetical protein
MEEYSRNVKRLTTEALTVVVREMAARTPPEMMNHNYLAFGLSTEVLRFFFGDQWVNEHIFPMHKTVSAAYEAGRKFLRTDSTEPDDSFRWGQRVMKLAQTLFNLQDTYGLRERIAQKGKDGLEGLLGEMECVALLCHPALSLRFRIPIGVKGQDYDAEVTTSANRTVCCEIETKIESTAVDTQTVWRTIDHARRQLPKDLPGVVLIKIPEAWPKNPDIVQIVEDAVAKAFRRSSRLVGVVFYWEEWFKVAGGELFINKSRPYVNNRSQLYQKDIDDMLGAIGQLKNPAWVSFHEFVEQIHPTDYPQIQISPLGDLPASPFSFSNPWGTIIVSNISPPK